MPSRPVARAGSASSPRSSLRRPYPCAVTPFTGSVGKRRRTAAGETRRGRSARPARPAGPLAGRAQADARRQQPAERVRRLALLGAVGERHRAVALGQPRAVGAEHERDVRERRAGEPEPVAPARAGAGWSPGGRRRGRPRRRLSRRRRRRPPGCRRTRRRCGARRSRRRRRGCAPCRRSANATRRAAGVHAQRRRPARRPRARRAAPRSARGRCPGRRPRAACRAAPSAASRISARVHQHG